MVIGDLDFKGVPLIPSEADTPLIMYPDAVLTCPITFQCFQSVARRYAQIHQFYSIFKKSQFAPCNFEQVTGESPFPGISAYIKRLQEGVSLRSTPAIARMLPRWESM